MAVPKAAPAASISNPTALKLQFKDLNSHITLFDTLRVTAADLQKALTAGALNSSQIVEEYHRQISKHNEYLKAVSELAPDAMARARELDHMRSQGSVLGPLHGIPVLLKDNINTDASMGLGTTGGALALVGSEPSGNAPIVDRLLDAGAIILGKATMSEMAFFKGTGIRCGWSAVYGQSQSAYVWGGLDLDDSIAGHSSPLGSSSGSAIAVSAGFAPLTVGTETSGSLAFPAIRASLYTVKPTRGIVSNKGIIPISTELDIAGPMAKGPKDVAELLTVLVDPSKTSVPEGGYASALGSDWSELKIGTLNPSIWTMPPHLLKPVEAATKQIVKEINEAYARVKTLAKAFHDNISDKTEDAFKLDGDSALWAKMTYQCEESLNEHLLERKTAKVRSLEELVKWNSEHADEALTAEYPNQDLLVGALKDEHDPEKLRKINDHLQEVGGSFVKLFDDYDIDVILSPGDGGVPSFSAACGFPIATLPLSYLDFNGRPFGLTIAARPHAEATLIKTMSAWEATFPPRQPPKAFLTSSKPHL